MSNKHFQIDKSEQQASANKIKVLRLIRDEREITRSEIIKISGLSAPTVTRIVESLVQMQLIQSDGTGESIGGRRPQIIRFSAKKNFVIGIDIGGTFIRSALSNLDGDFIYEIQVPTNIKSGFEGVMDQVGELINKLTNRAKQNKLELWGVGVAICGMVNKNTNLVEYSPIFNWRNVDVKQALSKYTGLDVVLGNVVQLIALGELLYGFGKSYNNFICLNLGYGIGSGIIADGKLFDGADGIAGEVGHIVVDGKSKRKGMEGVTGTLEALASGYGIADIAQELSRENESSSLNNLDASTIDAKSVFEAARNNDELANEVLDDAANYLSISIDTLIKLFNTECIVLSGGLIENKDIVFNKISDKMKNYSMKALSRSVPIVQSGFGENAALMGAFSLILEKILNLEK